MLKSVKLVVRNLRPKWMSKKGINRTLLWKFKNDILLLIPFILLMFISTCIFKGKQSAKLLSLEFLLLSIFSYFYSDRRKFLNVKSIFNCINCLQRQKIHRNLLTDILLRVSIFVYRLEYPTQMLHKSIIFEILKRKRKTLIFLFSNLKRTLDSRHLSINSICSLTLCTKR